MSVDRRTRQGKGAKRLRQGTEDTSVALMARAGVRPTPLRLAILGVLLQSGTPLQVTEVFRAMSAHGVDVSLSTVYGTLRSLSNEGVIAAHANFGRKMLYTVRSNPLGSVCLTCAHCRRKHVVSDPDLLALVAKLCNEHGMSLHSFDLNIAAVCRDCLAS